MGAHRTAGPDHESGSSGPMIPKAVIRTDHFAEEQSDVLSRIRTRGCRLLVADTKHMGQNQDLTTPEGRSPEG